jgi:hypothetical protein
VSAITVLTSPKIAKVAVTVLPSMLEPSTTLLSSSTSIVKRNVSPALKSVNVKVSVVLVTL